MRPAWLRWPLVLRTTHDRVVGAYSERLDAAVAAIVSEYDRATRDGRSKVHMWAIEANYNVFNHANPRGAAYAAFQEAERIFRPDPHPITEEVPDSAQ